MMPTDRFDRQLPVLLEELAQPRTPDYFDDLIGLAARTRQRPAWTIPERWLPMVDVAREPVIVPRLPLRTLGLGLLLIGLILAAIAALVLGQRQNLPLPFGPAANGLVAFDRDGDIYVADPRGGTERLVLAGPETDVRPEWSLDGTRFVFERKATGASGPGRLFTAKADGSDLTMVTPEPLADIQTYAFSPDGREIVVAAGSDTASTIHVARSDGSELRSLQAGFVVARDPVWRPSRGAEILFSGAGPDLYQGLFAFDARTFKVRTIIPAFSGRNVGFARWSPDGSRIAYILWYDAEVMTARTHVISADGNDDLLLTMPTGAVWEAFNDWSNDGTRLVNVRGYTGGMEDVRAVVAPADGRDTGVEIDHPVSIQQECCSDWEWAPDDSVILGTPTDATGTALPQVRLDLASGMSVPVAWATNSYPAWQRVAP